MEILNTLVIQHDSLDEPMYIEEYSSTKFSLLFQSSVLNSEITKSSLDMTDKFFSLEESIINGVEYINENGGFTIIGWYKRGQVQDRTVLVQNTNEQNSSKYGATVNQNVQVDNSQINFHPCVIRPTNKNFFVNGSAKFNHLKRNKFDVSLLMDTTS